MKRYIITLTIASTVLSLGLYAVYKITSKKGE